MLVNDLCGVALKGSLVLLLLKSSRVWNELRNKHQMPTFQCDFDSQSSSVPKLRSGAEHLVPLQTDSSVYAQGSGAV